MIYLWRILLCGSPRKGSSGRNHEKTTLPLGRCRCHPCYSVCHFWPCLSLFRTGSMFSTCPPSGMTSQCICSELLTLRRQSTISSNVPTLLTLLGMCCGPQPSFLNTSWAGGHLSSEAGESRISYLMEACEWRRSFIKSRQARILRDHFAASGLVKEASSA